VSTTLMVTTTNPYVGPRPFQTGETLYGRDREATELFNLLVAERIVLCYSPSGAGKSSLLNAGLAPRLRAEGFEVLPVMRVSLEPPETVPVELIANRYVLSLLLCLEDELQPGQQTPLELLAATDLAAYLERRPRATENPENLVLIFDQFEEILTVEPTNLAAKADFFAQVGKVLRDRGYWALFVMREDYVAGLDPYLRALPTRLGNTFRLDLLQPAAALLAVREPARRAGVDFAEDAAQKLVDDLRQVRVQGLGGDMEKQFGPYVEPVQLQVVCRRLWERPRLDPTRIGQEDVEAAGSVDRALSGYYAEQVSAVAAESGVSERAIREWCDRRLITEQGIRGQVLQGPERSEGLDNRAILLLVDTHLARAEKRRGATWYELAHDRLIEPVRDDNAEWFKANLSPLQRQADLWAREGRADGLLLRGAELAGAEGWAREHAGEVTSVENEFLEACRVADRRARRERHTNLIIRLLGLVAVGAFIWALRDRSAALDAQARAVAAKQAAVVAKDAAVVAKAMAVAAKRTAVQAAELADARELSSQSLALTTSQPDLALLLGVQATHARVNQAEAEGNLLTAVQAIDPRMDSWLHGHTKAVNSVALYGDLLASGSDDGAINLWNVSNPAKPRLIDRIGTTQTHAAFIRSVAFSLNGKMLATVDDSGVISLWNVSNPANPGAPTSLIQPPSGAVFTTRIAFSPRDQTLLAAGDSSGAISLYDVSNPRMPRPTTSHSPCSPASVSSMAFSRDGGTLAVLSGDNIHLYKVSGLDHPVCYGKFPEYPGPAAATSVAFSPRDHTLLAVGDTTLGTQLANEVTLWNVAKPKNPKEYPNHLSVNAGLAFSLAFSRDGKTLAAGNANGAINLWTVSNPLHVVPSGQPLIGHAQKVTSLVFGTDGILVSGSADHSVILWNVSAAPKPTIAVSPRQRSSVFATSSVAFSSDGRILAAGGEDNNSNGITTLWNVSNPANPGAPASLTLPPSGGEVTSIAFSPLDKTLLAAGSNDGNGHGAISLYKMSNLKTPVNQTGALNPINSIAFSPRDPTLLAAGTDDGNGHGAISLYKVSNLKTSVNQTGALNPINSVAFSPDGKILAAGDTGGTVTLWQASNLTSIGVYTPTTFPVYSVAFSPGGKMLAAGNQDGSITLLDVSDPRNPHSIKQLTGHSEYISSLAFSRDGRTLASGSYDGSAILWDVSDPKTIHPIGQPLIAGVNRVFSVAFSPDGMTLAVGYYDGSVLLWDVDPNHWVTKACQTANRNLTIDEWKSYVGSSSYRRTCPGLPSGDGAPKNAPAATP